MKTEKEVKDYYKEFFGLKKMDRKLEYYDNDIIVLSHHPVRYAFDKNFKRIKLKSIFKLYEVMSMIDFCELDVLDEQRREKPIIITANYIHRIKKENNIIGG